MALDFTVVRENLDYLLWGQAAASGEPGGLLLTLILSLCAGVLALACGVALALVVWIFGGITRRIIFLWADLIRAVPLVLVIFWLYFLLPALFGDVPGPLTVVLSLAWFAAASVMHSTLAGLEALPGGQAEAALASGLSRLQVLRLVLLPQAAPNLAPSFAGLFIALIKDTSLAFIVNVPELTTAASQVNNRTQVYPAEIFLTVGLLYLIPCASLSLLAGALQKRARPPGRPPAPSAPKGQAARRVSGTFAAKFVKLAEVRAIRTETAVGFVFKGAQALECDAGRWMKNGKSCCPGSVRASCRTSPRCAPG